MTTLLVTCRDRDHFVSAGRTPTPGLVVVDRRGICDCDDMMVRENEGWAVVHERSGLRVTASGSPEGALAAAAALAPVADWTRAGHELDNSKIRQAMRRIGIEMAAGSTAAGPRQGIAKRR